jgi:hypothetical protein
LRSAWPLAPGHQLYAEDWLREFIKIINRLFSIAAPTKWPSLRHMRLAIISVIREESRLKLVENLR